MNEAPLPLLPQVVARVSRALLAGLVLFWLGAICWLRDVDGVPDWWLPLALLVGALMPPPWLRLPTAPAVGRAWRWTALVVLGVAVAAITYGAVATPSRHWDGAAAFDAKAHWLVHAPTLQQPFFAAPAIFHHSPDYPLLLPLLAAMSERLLGGGLGRLCMPAIFVALLLVFATTAWRARWSSRLTLACVLAVGLTPALLGPGGGAVDSGYSDVALLLATTTIAAGLLLRSPFELVLGVLLALASKPEGIAYIAVAAVAAFVHGERRAVLTTCVAAAVGLVAWGPTQRCLLQQPAEGGVRAALLVGGAVLVAAAVMIGVDALARRSRHPGRWRGACALLAPLVGLLCLPWLANVVPEASAIGVYVHRGLHWQQGLANLPAFVAAFAQYALLRVNFGVTFLAVALLLLWPVRREVRIDQPAQRSLRLFVVLGLACSALPFVLTPEADVHHHLRSSLPRLLLHWLGPAWLLVGCRIAGSLPPSRAGADAATSSS